jgi:hypothetical protein
MGMRGMGRMIVLLIGPCKKQETPLENTYTPLELPPITPITPITPESNMSFVSFLLGL